MDAHAGLRQAGAVVFRAELELLPADMAARFGDFGVRRDALTLCADAPELDERPRRDVERAVCLFRPAFGKGEHLVDFRRDLHPLACPGREAQRREVAAVLLARERVELLEIGDALLDGLLLLPVIRLQLDDRIHDDGRLRIGLAAAGGG